LHQGEALSDDCRPLKTFLSPNRNSVRELGISKFEKNVAEAI